MRSKLFEIAPSVFTLGSVNSALERAYIRKFSVINLRSLVISH